jgi:hypothetical protein
LKSYFTFNSAKGLIESSEYLLDHVEDGEIFKNHNKYSFILVSAASLESLLNDGIISWAWQTFPKDDYKRQATAFLSMNLGKKIDALGFLLSSGKYITDNTHDIYQTLTNLIKLRNEVAHSKDFFVETEVEYGPVEEDGSRSFSFPPDIAKKMERTPLNIDNEQCKSIVNAIKHLEGILRYEIEHSDTGLFKAL